VIAWGAAPKCAGRRLLAAGPLIALVLAGCAPGAADRFPAAGAARVWPEPPEPARIRYVGTITGEASLGRRPAGLSALREVLTGPDPQIAFTTPLAVAVNGDRVWVADPGHRGGPAVFALDLAAQTIGTITQVPGGPLQWPIDLDVQAGKLAIADAKRAAVFVLDAASGRPRTAIGQGVLTRPASVAWADGGRQLWVLDAGGHRIVVFDERGQMQYELGGRGDQPGLLNFPAGISVVEPGPRVLVADAMNFRAQVLDAAGQPLLAFGRKGDAAGDFALPRDIACDSAGHIYVLDNQFENVQIFDPQGRLLLAFGEEGAGPGQFSLPAGITIDARDRIWIADTYNRRVQVFEYLPAVGGAASPARSEVNP